ncbi:nucleoside triphosphate pyrophosphohydrolase family protein [Sphingobacterium paludis]|uniref:Uncharacterized protein n=1 Tax=Sphingobacterium paludis TaxID=1476465 RepID=A0A4R7D3R3_9SPHI|nr:hypothetical protein [Sphingobacterium paludis]TDS14771.1 hypothetical protein B0I21_103270 [Sphingobacterium paludis]
MKELNENIITWAQDKGIFDSSSPLKQLTKTFEEVTELVTALVQKNEEEIVDAIGDVNVTLVILKKLAESTKESGDLANSKIFILINWIVEIFKKICQNKDVTIDVVRAQEMLHRVAQENNQTIESCTQSAYNVIAKRTGKMVDGVFVKDDPTEANSLQAAKPARKKPKGGIKTNE